MNFQNNNCVKTLRSIIFHILQSTKVFLNMFNFLINFREISESRIKNVMKLIPCKLDGKFKSVFSVFIVLLKTFEKKYEGTFSIPRYIYYIYMYIYTYILFPLNKIVLQICTLVCYLLIYFINLM